MSGAALLACLPAATLPTQEPSASASAPEARSEAPAVFIEAPSEPVLDPPPPEPELESAATDEETVDPELELAAKLAYAAAIERFEAQDFAGALANFEAAHALLPLPALKYNIAHCLEELGRVSEACAAYREVRDFGHGDQGVRAESLRSLARLGC